MKTSLKYAVILMFIAFVAGCKKENRFDWIKGTGNIIRETRMLPVVSHFHFGHGKINAVFTQNSTFLVEVEAGDKLMNLITTEVRNDTLFIEDRNKGSFTRSYKKQITIYISLPLLEAIVQRGPGRITSTNTLTGPRIAVETWSGGDIDLKVGCFHLWTHLHKTTSFTATGEVLYHEAYLWHNSTFYGSGLKTNDTYFFNNTTGNMYCKADSTLRADIRLSGTIYYSGNPIISVVNQGGTGTVLKQ